MCGIFFTAGHGSTDNNTDSWLRHSTIAGQVRGMEGTGVIMQSKKDGVTYIKSELTGTEFIQTRFDPELDVVGGVHTVIGHNRAATSGAVSKDTSHPFHEGDVIGVHNGTLHASWRSDLEVSKKCDVDSRGLFRAIAAKGPDWALERACGAIAIVWIHLPTQQAYVYRNSERPLYYATSTSGRLYAASEAGMLAWLMEKHNIYLKAGTGIEAFKTNTLYNVTGGQVIGEREIRGPSSYYQQWAPSKATTGKPPIRGNSLQSTATGPANYDDGIPFYGRDVPEEYLVDGIVEEYVERGHAEYTCDCCSTPITGTFLESLDDWNPIVMHPDCLPWYRSTMSSSEPMRMIKRAT